MIIFTGLVCVFLAFLSGMLVENGLTVRWFDRDCGVDRVFAGVAGFVAVVAVWLIVVLA